MIQDIPLSVLQTEASPKMSERYVHINSMDVVREMEQEGWILTSAKTAKPRTRDPLFAKHSLDFRRESAEEIEGMVPRIIFTNAHDGSAKAFAAGGFFRFVCSNGLVIGNVAAYISSRHSGVDAKTFAQQAKKLAEETERQRVTIERWNRLDLSAPQRVEYARLAGALRFGDAEAFAASELLKVRREEDDSGTLLTVFNRVQENGTRGGLSGIARSGRRIMSRPTKSIGSDMKFNTSLWKMTEELSNIWG